MAYYVYKIDPATTEAQFVERLQTIGAPLSLSMRDIGSSRKVVQHRPLIPPMKPLAGPLNEQAMIDWINANP